MIVHSVVELMEHYTALIITLLMTSYLRPGVSTLHSRSRRSVSPFLLSLSRSLSLSLSLSLSRSLLSCLKMWLV